MPVLNLTKRSVDSVKLDPAGPRYLFDRTLQGFGLKLSPPSEKSPNGVRTYFIQYRLGKGRRAEKVRQFIGRHGSPWTPESARRKAEQILAQVKLGQDPHAEERAQKTAITMAELCESYLAKAESGEIRTRTGRQKKASTLATDRGRIHQHIIPLLGKKIVTNIDRQDIIDFQNAVAAGKTAKLVTRDEDPSIKAHGRTKVTGGDGTAARTVGLLGAILSFAISQSIRPDNPRRGVVRPKDQKHDRFLDADEYHLLGSAIAAARHKNKPNRTALAAIELLTLTGMRKGEVLGLKWSEIDEKRRIFRLGDTKTGLSVRPISRAALSMIKSIARTDEVHVFPGAKAGRPLVGLPKIFAAILSEAKIADVSLHTLRHSFATAANELGMSESTIAALLGHARHTVTARYTHIVDATLLAAADRISAWIAAALKREAPTVSHVIQLSAAGR